MGKLADLILGKHKYCWEVRSNGRQIGYLCETYEMFRDLILGSELPANARITVHQVYRRYRKPRHRIENPFTAKGERKKIKQVGARVARPHKTTNHKRRRHKVWRFGRGSFRRRH